MTCVMITSSSGKKQCCYEECGTAHLYSQMTVGDRGAYWKSVTNLLANLHRVLTYDTLMREYEFKEMKIYCQVNECL